MPVQVIPEFVVFDYEYDDESNPLIGVEVAVTRYPTQGATSIAPLTSLTARRYKAVTDSTGRWQLSLISTTNIGAPTGYGPAYYVGISPSRGSFRFLVPGGPGPYQASANPAP